MSSPKRQRQKEARARKAAELAKAKRRADLIRTIRTWALMVTIVLVLGYFFFIRGNDSTPADTTTPVSLEEPSTEFLSFTEQPTACGGNVPEFKPRNTYETFEPQGIDKKVTAVITTSCGEISVELDPFLAPDTVDNFVFLAREDFYDGMVVHRIDPGFVIQAGDPLADGTGDPGYSLLDEIPSGFQYEKGVVAMARHDLVSGSQFFIVTGDEIEMDPIYNPLGRVVDGWDVIETIAAIEVGPNTISGAPDRPLESVYIEDIRIVTE